jgi:hypothetical protein
MSVVARGVVRRVMKSLNKNGNNKIFDDDDFAVQL